MAILHETACVEPEDALKLGLKDGIRTGIHVPKAIAQAMTPIPFSFSLNGEIQCVPVTSPRNAVGSQIC
jgi:hypothetical protein